MRGEVVLADSVTRAIGVIVEVRDSTGALAGRTLTGVRGAFSITLPASGRYFARALRIGFRPTIVPPFDATSETPSVLRIVLGSEVVRLAEVKVSTDDACGIRSDSGKLVAQVWEETRKALTSAALTESQSRTLVTDRLVYGSTRRVDGDAAPWQSVDLASTGGLRAFVSPPADSLATFGYSVTRSGQRVAYLGVEATALIADEFAAGHCFRVVPPPSGREGWLGVQFRPVRERRGVVEIAGTFWVDRESAELRLLDYRYTNAPAAVERGGGGGQIEFVRLGPGEWLLNRWQIRIPALELIQQRDRIEAGYRGALRTVTRTQIREYLNVSGGEVLSVVRDGAEAYRDGGISWDARLIVPAGDSIAAGATGATIEFLDAPYFAMADSLRRLHLDHVQPGRYDAVISTGAMRAMELPALRRKIVIGPTTRAQADTVTLPSDTELLAQRCGKDAVNRKRAVIYGVVVDAGRVPIAYDTITVRWIEAPNMGRNPRPVDAEFSVTSDAVGRWYVCGVPRDATMAFSKEKPNQPPLTLLELTVGRDELLVGVEIVGMRPPR